MNLLKAFGFIIIALTPLALADSNSVQQPYTITGIVVDATADYSDEFFVAFEKAVASNSRSFDDEKRFAPLPLSEIVITLKGKSLTKQTTTDPEGKFAFKNLPYLRKDPNTGKDFYEDYEVSAFIPKEMQDEPNAKDVLLKQYVTLNYNKFLRFEYRADLITVKGRITDANGEPIAGAKVIGRMELQSETSELKPEKREATTDKNGYYKLLGYTPPDAYRTAGYLNGGNPMADPGMSFFLDIHVKASGFVQTPENTPRVPLVSENLLTAARRIHKILYDYEHLHHDPNKPYNIKEESPDIAIPASIGNTITGIDIVLTPENSVK